MVSLPAVQVALSKVSSNTIGRCSPDEVDGCSQLLGDASRGSGEGSGEANGGGGDASSS